MREPLICPDCTAFMRLMHSRFGYFFGCCNYPVCDATHPADSSGNPIGRPRSAALKQQQQQVLTRIRELCGGARKIPESMKRRYERVLYHWLAANMPWQKRGVECFVMHFDEQETARAFALLQAISLREILSWGRKHGFWARQDNTATPAAFKRPGASIQFYNREAR